MYCNQFEASFHYDVPNFIRDYIFKIIAKTRYKIFGRNDSCIY